MVPPGPHFPAPSAPCPSLLAPSLTGLPSWWQEDCQSFLSTSHLRSTREKVSPKRCLVLVLTCTGSNLNQSVHQDREYAQPLAWTTGSCLRRMTGRGEEGDAVASRGREGSHVAKTTHAHSESILLLTTSKCLLC